MGNWSMCAWSLDSQAEILAKKDGFDLQLIRYGPTIVLQGNTEFEKFMQAIYWFLESCYWLFDVRHIGRESAFPT
jgi:hypothetical protein